MSETRFVDISDEIERAAADDPTIDEGVAEMWEAIRRESGGGTSPVGERDGLSG